MGRKKSAEAVVVRDTPGEGPNSTAKEQSGRLDGHGPQRHGTGRQLDLFDEALRKAVCPGATGDGGNGAGAREERQVSTVYDQQRALTQHLMEEIASSANLNQAYKRVKVNWGAPGFAKSIQNSGAKPVIPGRKSRKKKIKLYKNCYKFRWLAEVVFCRLKDLRRVATRYDKLARNFKSTLAIAIMVMYWR